MTLYAVDVRNAILDAIYAAPWNKVTYDNSNKQLRPVASVETFAPKSVNVNEVSSTRGVERRHGRSRKTIKEAWTFEAIVEWTDEAVLDAGEEQLGAGLYLPETENYRAFVVDLVSSRYEHPVALNSSKGSRALFTFTVRYGRN